MAKGKLLLAVGLDNHLARRDDGGGEVQGDVRGIAGERDRDCNRIRPHPRLDAAERRDERGVPGCVGELDADEARLGTQLGVGPGAADVAGVAQAHQANAVHLRLLDRRERGLARNDLPEATFLSAVGRVLAAVNDQDRTLVLDDLHAGVGLEVACEDDGRTARGGSGQPQAAAALGSLS
jgi:hypothetical protein